MTRSLFTFCLVASLAASGKAWELRRLPTASDRAKVLADGWTSSRDSLGGALVAAYQPGGPRRPGSTGVTAYRAWMHLWKWCDVLARNERKEAARLLAAISEYQQSMTSRCFILPATVPNLSEHPYRH